MHRSLVPLVLMVALAAPVAPAGEVHACVNIIGRTTEDDIRSVDTAGALLDEGAYQQAVHAVMDAFPRAHRRPADADEPLLARGQRMVAVAVVRSDGAVRLSVRLRGKTARQRAAAIAWATTTLRRAHALRSDDGTVTAELAEALALDPAARPEALTLLRGLGEADLMPGARAWGVLAALERVGGDVVAADEAMRRCSAIAGDAAACQVRLASA